MNNRIKFQSFQFKIKNSKIVDLFDLTELKLIRGFPSNLNQNNYKIYIITIDKTILYIGVTKRGIRSRLYTGLKASGKNGYHGYKWKNTKAGKIHVIQIAELKKEEVENVEAEIVYIVRNTTGKWPLFQNEIHFNNNYKEGEKYARAIFTRLPY